MVTKWPRTFRSSCGEGYAARMADAMSGLTLLNCWICLLQACSRPLPPRSTRCPPAHSLSRWNEKPVCSLSRLRSTRRERSFYLEGGRRGGVKEFNSGGRSLERRLRHRSGRHDDVSREVLPGQQEADGDAGVELEMHHRLTEFKGTSSPATAALKRFWLWDFWALQTDRRQLGRLLSPLGDGGVAGWPFLPHLKRSRSSLLSPPSSLSVPTTGRLFLYLNVSVDQSDEVVHRHLHHHVGLGHAAAATAWLDTHRGKRLAADAAWYGLFLDGAAAAQSLNRGQQHAASFQL
ncbi:hypothetical protein EYF80_047752 [Liparis tanakae]|uniref:Uncharacterized protein n=1 Tax=Liparis tanakae TaxID=230148 RepID=A0A4Z2FP32_9TELE|nr:hypothetical protein EYF80_047752 [Liparis tanakae]